MSPKLSTGLGLAPCFPRVSGDEPRFEGVLRGAILFSPRERG